MFCMFGFFCYSYFMGSVLIQYEVNNPNTGEPFTILTIVICA